MVSAKQAIPPPLLTRNHKAVALAATETPVSVTTPAGGGMAETSAFGTWSAINLRVIDFDATELPSNDRDIYEVMLEHMLAVPVEWEIEAPEAATSAAASSAEVAASASGEPVPGVVMVGNPCRARVEVLEVSCPQSR
jgi:hypothetical protein